jgi:hypothetical protein
MKNRIIVAVLLGLSAAAYGQQNPQASITPQTLDALQQQIRDLQERVIALEGQLRVMKAQPVPTPQPAQGTEAASTAAQPAVPPPSTEVASQTGGGPASGGPAEQEPRLGGASALAKALNPDISMIGDFLGSLGGNSPPLRAQQTPVRSFEMHESELGIQAIIDPYARGDFFITFGEQGVSLEEGYITFTSLPAGFVGKIGKMRAAFGKVNTMHNHVLPWVDRPLVTDNLVGGEDGINDAGISVTRTFAAPRNLFLEATGQVFRGDSGDSVHQLFAAPNKSDVSTIAHLRGYRDITESTNLDIGVSFARGHSDLGGVNVAQDLLNRSFITYLYGADATLRWRPLRRSIYHSFIARSEFIWNQRQQFNAAFLPATKRSFGYYASGDYQLGRRWFVGGRFDSSDRATSPGTDHGASAVLTFWPSEFSQLRGQYRLTRYAEGINANELLMQLQFVLGAHGAHPF